MRTIVPPMLSITSSDVISVSPAWSRRQSSVHAGNSGKELSSFMVTLRSSRNSKKTSLLIWSKTVFTRSGQLILHYPMKMMIWTVLIRIHIDLTTYPKKMKRASCQIDTTAATLVAVSTKETSLELDCCGMTIKLSTSLSPRASKVFASTISSGKRISTTKLSSGSLASGEIADYWLNTTPIVSIVSLIASST